MSTTLTCFLVRQLGLCDNLEDILMHVRVHGLMGAHVLASQVTAAVGNRLRPSLRPATTCRSVNRIQTNARCITHAQASSSHDAEKPVAALPEVQSESGVGESLFFQRALLTATASLTPFLLSAQVHKNEFFM
jgi:hypothetical protein